MTNPTPSAPPQVELLYWPGCSSHPRALTELREALADLGVVADVAVRTVTTQEQATKEAFVGSPTIRVNGHDVVDPGDRLPSLTCRVYRRGDGAFLPVPDPDELRAALTKLLNQRSTMTDITVNTPPAGIKLFAGLPVAIMAFADAAIGGTAQARESLRPYLADDAEFPFVTMNPRGPDEIVEHLAQMPSARIFKGATWRAPEIDGNTYTLHADYEPGEMLTAFVFTVRMNSEDKIDHVEVRPLHDEPADLVAPMAIGAVAPAFELKDVYGESFLLHDGDPASATLVLWTCNECPWALGWHARLQDLIRDYTDRGVRSLQIAANDPKHHPADAPERSLERVKAGEFASPYLLDEGQKVARQWGARHTPEIFVLDAQGRLQYHGACDESAEDLTLRAEWVRDALDSVLEGKPVANAETEPIGCTIKWTM